MRSLIALMVSGIAVFACKSTPPPAAPAPVANVPAAPAAAAPASRVLRYSIVRNGGQHAGDSVVTIDPDGTRHEHFSFNDRGRGPDLQTVSQLDASGLPRAYHTTGVDYYKAPVDETLEEVAGTLRWRSKSEHGEAPAGSGFYQSLDGGADYLIVPALLHAADHRIKILPAGEAWIEDDNWRTFDVSGSPHKLRRLAIAGLSFSPELIWLDDHDDIVGVVSTWLSVIRTDSEPALAALIADNNAWSTARAAQQAAEHAHKPPAAGLAFVHARLFDSVRKTITPDATVVVVGDRITAVGGPHTPVPAGALVVDAAGKTLLPGLWDMHVHLTGSTAGLLDLASGITTVRDLGNNLEELDARVSRYDAGTELGPRVLRAGLIDGPGQFAAPIGLVAGTAEQALAAVKRYADAGYVQIKMYSSLDPKLVPVIARDAHKRGLRVSGHVPTGMNAAEAVEAGYDELQHANFLFLRFLAKPGMDTRTPVRFTEVAEHAVDLDLASPEVRQFLDLLIAHKTVLDPTLSAFDDMFNSDPGQIDPVMAPYEARLPVGTARGSRSGGLPAPDGKRETFRASHVQMLRMVKLAWDRKIPIVAGTDHINGLTLSHELELYVKAGIPAPEVLSIATIGAAKVMHVDRESGSIAVGKRADLVLVDGDPTRDISAVRNTVSVVCRGIAYDPAELFPLIGMRAR